MKPILAIAVFCLAVLGQSGKPAFDVATVKPNDPSSDVLPSMAISVTQYSAVASLRSLIQSAYGMRAVGGPAWVDTELFDVTARPANPAAHD